MSGSVNAYAIFLCLMAALVATSDQRPGAQERTPPPPLVIDEDEHRTDEALEKARRDFNAIARHFESSIENLRRAIDTERVVKEQKGAVVQQRRAAASTPQPTPTAQPSPSPTRSPAKTLLELFH